MEQYVGEIRIFAGNFAPSGWHICDGSVIPVSQYQALYALIGNTYGGDIVNFKLPDLRGRLPIGIGISDFSTGYEIGNIGGLAEVRLTDGNNPVHTHALKAANENATTGDPTGINLPAISLPQDGTYTSIQNYMPLAAGTTTPDSVLNSNSTKAEGLSLPHNNMMPFMTMNYIISLTGIFPNQS